jgi:hypothetical protein
MSRGCLDWQAIAQDLALHLRSALTLEQVHRIVDDADRDLARLGEPADFWVKVELEYQRIASRLQRERAASQTGADLFTAVRTLIGAKAKR